MLRNNWMTPGCRYKCWIFFSARQNDALNALMKLQSYGVTLEEILNSSRPENAKRIMRRPLVYSLFKSNGWRGSKLRHWTNSKAIYDELQVRALKYCLITYFTWMLEEQHRILCRSNLTVVVTRQNDGSHRIAKLQDLSFRIFTRTFVHIHWHLHYNVLIVYFHSL